MMKISDRRKKVIFVCNDKFFIYGASVVLSENKNGRVLVADSEVDLEVMNEFDYVFLDEKIFNGWYKSNYITYVKYNFFIVFSMENEMKNSSVADYFMCKEIDAKSFLNFFSDLIENKTIGDYKNTVLTIKDRKRFPEYRNACHLFT
ncbi:hypothetical protein ACGVWS_05600 [Enterobacteriaceae bacterium LUAb1]